MGDYHNTPQAEFFVSNRNVSLVVLEPEKAEIKVPADLLSGEGPSLVRRHFLAVASWERRGIQGPPFIRAPIPRTRAEYL